MEDRLALRLEQIRRQCDHAIRTGQKLDPRTIRDLTTGTAKG